MKFSTRRATKIKAMPGWLAPTGEFYPVPYQHHTEGADRLFKRLYPEQERAVRKEWGYVNGDTQLAAKGWVRISDEGKVTDANWHRVNADDLTQAQLDTLGDMLSDALERKLSVYPKDWAGNLNRAMSSEGVMSA